MWSCRDNQEVGLEVLLFFSIRRRHTRWTGDWSSDVCSSDLFGPVGDVDQTLARSAEELRVWVEEVKQARGTGLDLDHAVAMVRDRTKQRYALFLPETDPEVAARFERLTGAASNVAGIMHWLDQSAGQGA